MSGASRKRFIHQNSVSQLAMQPVHLRTDPATGRTRLVEPAQLHPNQFHFPVDPAIVQRFVLVDGNRLAPASESNK